MLVAIKKYIPKTWLNAIRRPYHYIFAFLAACFYGNPSKKMIVVGVTGTTGKTSTVYLVAKILQAMGVRVGYTSTALLGDGKKEWLNDKKMTMLGRFQTQKILASMVKNNCDIAIVETTSEGIRQFRHRFIHYDICVFTGLYPEHIESHGGFLHYKDAKLELFRHLEALEKKTIGRVQINRGIIANIESEHAADFLDFEVEKKIGFGREENVKYSGKLTDYLEGSQIGTNQTGVHFLLGEKQVQSKILGEHNVMNILAAIGVGRAFEKTVDEMLSGLSFVSGIPGRLERIDEGQDFEVVVDYAFEPVALELLYKTIEDISHNDSHSPNGPHSRILHVLGSTGGGRDVSRREKLGEIAGEKADVVIVTNEDPYDEDPQKIIDAVVEGAKKTGKSLHKNLYAVLDRREAIKKALVLAKTGDTILITGKGCEQAICIENEKKIPWDDRMVVREELEKKRKGVKN